MEKSTVWYIYTLTLYILLLLLIVSVKANPGLVIHTN